jgi:sugar/nucleoside kinase (ribokinase family)
MSIAVSVVGSTTIDQNEFNGRTAHKPGGTTVYAGITYRRHGLSTRVVTRVAARDVGILDCLQREKVQVYNGGSEHTCIFQNFILGDARRQTMPSAASPIDRVDLGHAMGRPGLIHLGPLHPLDIEAAALRDLGRTDATIALDVQGYARRVADGRVVACVSGPLAEALYCSRIVKASLRELETVLAHFRMSPADLIPEFGIRELVVTKGSAGGWVQTDGGRVFHYGARPAAAHRDPTGAGDVFFAAYLIRRLRDNAAIPDALDYAAGLAAEQVAGAYLTEDLLKLPPVTAA